ncbi:MAG TPA: S53 family peptidase [Solirubrobacteraceae bacterium]|jgi:subtilase family serine protease|nr:S53 family peptidase [Solirubrobacteraceae bacterium]
MRAQLRELNGTRAAAAAGSVLLIVVALAASEVAAAPARGSGSAAAVHRLPGGILGAAPPQAQKQLRLTPPTLAQCLKATGDACYSPSQLQHAYDLGPLYAQGFDGRGSTIVIVDPFGSPTIGHDLGVFDSELGLPNPPAFRVLQPVGPVPPFDPNNPEMVEKAGETTLDVEWSHAVAPKANILLVETATKETASGGGFPQMLAAETYVIDHNLGDVISQSFSLPEQNFPSRAFIMRLRRTYINADRNRVTMLAASNDNGVTGPTPPGPFYTHRVVEWPASDPLVAAVGGTQLHLTSAGRRTSPDSAWNDTWNRSVAKLTQMPVPFPWAGNGGVSAIFARPSYQNSVRRSVGNRRGVPDVAMSGSFSGAVLVFSSYLGSARWGQAGGTSEATPEFAGIVAIADQYARTRLHRGRLGLINPALYRLHRRPAGGIVEVKQGNSTVTFPVPPSGRQTFTLRGYRAHAGYNLVTGVGTIDAARFVPALARAG